MICLVLKKIMKKYRYFFVCYHLKCIISVPMLPTVFSLESFHCPSRLLMWIHSCIYCCKHSREKCYIHIALHLKGYLSLYHMTKSFVPSHGSALLVQYRTISLLISSLCDVTASVASTQGASQTVCICCLQQSQAPCCIICCSASC